MYLEEDNVTGRISRMTSCSTEGSYYVSKARYFNEKRWARLGKEINTPAEGYHVAMQNALK